MNTLICNHPSCIQPVKVTGKEFCSRQCSANARSNTIEYIRTRIQYRDNPGMGSPCHMWTGACADNGYGHTNFGGTLWSTHRLFYLVEHGSIPEGMEIHHECGVRECCSALHLRAVTRKENILASNSFAAVNARKTHCLRGHELAGDNLMAGALKRGQRKCKLCNAMYNLKSNAKAKARRKAAREAKQEAELAPQSTSGTRVPKLFLVKSPD